MACRKSTVFFSVIAAITLLVAGLFSHARMMRTAALPQLAKMTALVRQLELTDLCLFTEASYTRHLALTDFTTPFQEGPSFLEHFPSGTLVDPPAHLVRKTGGACPLPGVDR